MTAPAWMPLYVADYIADTGHLTAAQHGAYLMLIMHYWRTGSLPKTDDALARVARMSPDEWHANRDAIASFFTPEWTHKRVDYELSKGSEIASARTLAGKAGAKARWQKRKSHNSKRNADALAKTCPSPSPSPSPKQEEYPVATQPTAGPSFAGPLDFKKELWGRGVPFLKTCGIDEAQARAMLGKWRKTHGDFEVLNALAAAEAAAASEPLAYIQKTLNAKAKPNGTGQSRLSEHPLGIFGEIGDELTSGGISRTGR